MNADHETLKKNAVLYGGITVLCIGATILLVLNDVIPGFTSKPQATPFPQSPGAVSGFPALPLPATSASAAGMASTRHKALQTADKTLDVTGQAVDVGAKAAQAGARAFDRILPASTNRVEAASE